MNKALLRDPLFWAGVLAVSFGLFQLAAQNITLPSFSSAGSIKTFDDTTPRKVKASQATLNMLGQVNQYKHQAQAKPLDEQMIKKSRPKNSDSIWRVGSSEHADSNDLSAVLANLLEGDSIELESGDYEFKCATEIEKVLIEALPEAKAVIRFSKGVSLSRLPKQLTFRNITFDLSKEATAPYFMGWDKTVEMDNVQLDGNSDVTMYFTDGVIFKLKNSKAQNVSFRFDGSSQGHFENVNISKVSSFAITLGDNSVMNLKNVKISQSNTAISIDNNNVQFKAENLSISEGHYAFYASKTISKRIDVLDGQFARLRRVLSGDNLRLACERCSEVQITDPY